MVLFIFGLKDNKQRIISKYITETDWKEHVKFKSDLEYRKPMTGKTKQIFSPISPLWKSG